MNHFTIIFARSLYKNKLALKERIRDYLQGSDEVQEAIKRGAVAAKLLGGCHRSFTDGRNHFTMKLLPSSLKLGKIHVPALSWSVPPDYLEEGTDRVTSKRGFDPMKQK